VDKPENNPIFCSFCGKNQREVQHLVQGRAVYICNECWEVAADVMAKTIGVEPSLVYVTIKKRRLDQAELFVRRAMAMVRTTAIVAIGAENATECPEAATVPEGDTP
jgi:ATP-dependent protease Clp ATPase subunit